MISNTKSVTSRHHLKIDIAISGEKHNLQKKLCIIFENNIDLVDLLLNFETICFYLCSTLVT